jgi:hypothetical protein
MPGALGEAFSLPPPSLDRWVGCRGRAAAPTAADHEPFRFQVQDEIVSGFERYGAGFCAQLTSVGPFSAASATWIAWLPRSHSSSIACPNRIEEQFGRC